MIWSHKAQGPRCQRRIQHHAQEPIQHTPRRDSFHYRPIPPGHDWCCDRSHRLQKTHQIRIVIQKYVECHWREEANKTRRSEVTSLNEKAAALYREKGKEVKKPARRDKRFYTDQLAEEAQKTAEIKKKWNRILDHKETKRWFRPYQQNMFWRFWNDQIHPYSLTLMTQIQTLK